MISAIDYSTEYSDWLMPTPPSSSIPIVDDEPEEPQPSKPEKSKHNHNIPEQMELFELTMLNITSAKSQAHIIIV